jgi:RNA polymerase sigma factor for flagellar operon FliA
MSEARAAPHALTAAQRAEVEKALPNAQALARRMASRCPGLDVDELVAVGRAALAAAARTHDPRRGVPLAIYAHKGMRGAMMRASKKHAGKPLTAAWLALLAHEEAVEESTDLAAEISESDEQRKARAFGLGADAALAAFLGYKGKAWQASPEEQLSSRQEHALVRDVVETLGEGAEIIDLLYFQDMDWPSAAERLGISISSAQRLETKLLPRLRAALLARGVLTEVA